MRYTTSNIEMNVDVVDMEAYANMQKRKYKI